MGYETNPIDPGPSGLERFLEDKNVWLFLCFVLSADVAASLYLRLPLSALRLDELNKTLPIGAIVIFIALFAILVLVSWKLRLWFYSLTSGLAHLVEREKSSDEYRSRELHSVSSFTLHAYAIQHDHQVLYDMYRRHSQWLDERRWTLVFVFVSGALLAVHPFLPTSTLHVHVFSRIGISDWWILVMAVPLMIYGAHSNEEFSQYVHVGSQAAAAINKGKRNSQSP